MSKKKKFATSISAQNKRFLEALRNREGLGITTIYAREELDIMMPAARIYELRHKEGYNIQMLPSNDVNAQGNKHTCSRYVLLSGRWKGRNAA